MPDEPGFETLCAHEGDDPSRFHGAPVPPIYQNSLFTVSDAELFFTRTERRPEGYDYTRVANPTTDVLEAKLAALERTEACRCFGSGMAAVSAAILHAVRAGDHVVAVDSCYGPTRQFLSDYLPRFNIDVTYVPGDDPEDFAAASKPNTRLYYLESPSSLVFRQQDLRAVGAIAKEREIVTVIDNSWATPYFQNPTDFGVDLILHSATKYLGGHSDVVAGVLCGPDRLLDSIKAREGQLLGGILDPFAAWLLLRGLRTLPVRMKQHQENGISVARFLESHPAVERVFYPGLSSDPQHDLGRQQLRGHSGLLSIALRENSRDAVCRILNRLRYFGIGVSWGGFESLAIPVELPMPGTNEKRWGIRLSIGLETLEDLLADLEEGLR